MWPHVCTACAPGCSHTTWRCPNIDKKMAFFFSDVNMWTLTFILVYVKYVMHLLAVSFKDNTS